MATHNLYHLRAVRRTTGRRSDHLRRFAEVLRVDGRGRHGAEHLHVSRTVVIEPVNGAPRNAERLPRPHIDQLAVNGPGQTPSMP